MKNELSEIKNIVGDSFEFRVTRLDPRRVFVKCIAKSPRRGQYSADVTAAVAALKDAGYASAEVGHNANTVSLFA